MKISVLKKNIFILLIIVFILSVFNISFAKEIWCKSCGSIHNVRDTAYMYSPYLCNCGEALTRIDNDGNYTWLYDKFCNSQEEYNSYIDEKTSKDIPKNTTMYCPNGHGHVFSTLSQDSSGFYICPDCESSYSAGEWSDNSGKKYNEYAKELNDEEEVLKNNKAFVDMINEIFSTNLNEEIAGLSLFSPSKMMITLNASLIQASTEFGKTSLYYLFVGIGIFFMFVNFIINFYQNKMNNESKTMEQMIQLIFQIFVCVLVILNLKNMIVLFLTFFGFVLQQAINFQETDLIFKQEGIATLSGGDHIAYLILSQTGVSSKVIDIFKSGAGMMLQIKFFIPWLIALVGKYGILFAVIKNAVETMIQIILFPISAGDLSENIKQSRFLKYFKTILSLCLQQTVIVVALIASNYIMSSILNQTISQVNFNNAFSLAMVFAIVNLCKMVAVTTLSGGIAKAVFGV